MPSVISCSRRTDIPAFYTPWLMERLRSGFCHTFNPFSGQVYRISLKPEDVIAMTFWTRNPAPLYHHLDELEQRGYTFYFNVSILGYPRAFEPHSPATEDAIRTFKAFAARLSPQRMRWRYDPIILSSATPVEYHLEQFDALSSALEGSTQHCTFSFVQYYGKTTRNLSSAASQAGITLQHPTVEEQRALAAKLAEIARRKGMRFSSCCNDLLVVEGVTKSHCVDPELIRALAGEKAAGLKAKPTRPDCGCSASVDIGVYDTCLFGCGYCYATSQQSVARARRTEHVASDSLLWRPEALRGADLDRIAVPLKTI